MVLVSMAANEREITWLSRLDTTNTLTLTAPGENDWLETWQADIGPMWHVEVDGIPPIHHQDKSNNWLPKWQPWPGEEVTFNITRPTGVEGHTITIDQSILTVKPGKRASDSSLSFTLRASQGGQYDLELPAGAELRQVKINGRTQPVRQNDRLVSLPVIPGKQTFELNWREMTGMDTVWRSPQLRHGEHSVNANLVVKVPRDRWTLWLNGPDLGPAVLFWSVLIILVFIAAALTRVSSSYLPLGFVSWLLLGIGLSQVSIFSGILVIAWFFTLHYRSKLDSDTIKSHFNLTQIAIVLLTFVSLSILFWAVKEGLLGLPEMQIRGYGSNAYTLNWYQDRITQTFPEATVISVPLLVYRGLMLAWALWLAFALLKWLKWGWTAFSSTGLWRTIEIPKTRRRRKTAARESHEASNAASKQDTSTS
jgi:hypothetical protein